MTDKHKIVPASYLVLIKNNKILLLKRHNTGYEDGKYSIIAGHVEPNETFTQCLVREAKEEAGIIIKPEDLKTVHIMHRNSGTAENNERVDVFFKVRKWFGRIRNNEPYKCSDLSWHSLNNFPKETIPYIKQAIEKISAGIFYSEHGWSN